MGKMTRQATRDNGTGAHTDAQGNSMAQAVASNHVVSNAIAGIVCGMATLAITWGGVWLIICGL